MSTITDRISQVLEDSGLKKVQFAERLSVSQAYISQLSSGTRIPSDRTIADICREFRVREEWLRTGEGPMRYPEPDSNMVIINRLLADDPDEVVQFVTKFMAAYETLPDSSKAVLCDLIRSLHEK